MPFSSFTKLERLKLAFQMNTTPAHAYNAFSLLSASGFPPKVRVILCHVSVALALAVAKPSMDCELVWWFVPGEALGLHMPSSIIFSLFGQLAKYQVQSTIVLLFGWQTHNCFSVILSTTLCLSRICSSWFSVHTTIVG